MNILHYVMGIPPVRGGGAIKYAIDLAEKQAELNQNVALLYPGAIYASKKTYIKKRSKKNKVKYFEIINPLPVPGAFGMCNEKYFMQKVDPQIYYDFLEENGIDIIHFHSLQGLHRELSDAADNLHIIKVFTSHDYFGICPKTDLLFKDRICNDTEWKHCGECCDHPDSYATLVRRQSHWFRNLVKCTPLLGLIELAWKIIRESLNIANPEEKGDTKEAQTVYTELKDYYAQIFRKMDLMHYNSTVAKMKYEEFLGFHTFLLEGVTHRDIVDKREKKCCGEVIRFGFLGNGGLYKGFPMLIEVLDKIYAEKKNRFILNIYFHNDMNREYIVCHNRYQYSEIDKVFSDMDILLFPSLCAETYGLVVPEAIMHGVPVVITSNVGAKDLIEMYNEIGLIVNPAPDDWENALLELLNNTKIIGKMNKNICESNIELNFDKHTQKMLETYRNLQSIEFADIIGKEL